MADIFLSYKKADRDRVEGLAHDLTEDGFTVWWDYALESGDNWFERILDEVKLARCLVGCWTNNAIAPNGTFTPSKGDGTNYLRIEHEAVGRARIAGAMMDNDAVPLAYRDLQFSDLTSWRPGMRLHEGYRSLVVQAERLATPAFVQRSIAVIESDRSKAIEQMRAARLRAEELQTQLSRHMADAAAREETYEADLYAQRQRLAEQDEKLRQTAQEAQKLTSALTAKEAAHSDQISILQGRLDDIQRENAQLSTRLSELKASQQQSRVFDPKRRESLAVHQTDPAKYPPALRRALNENRIVRDSSSPLMSMPVWPVLLGITGFIALAVALGGWFTPKEPPDGPSAASGKNQPAIASIDDQRAERLSLYEGAWGLMGAGTAACSEPVSVTLADDELIVGTVRERIVTGLDSWIPSDGGIGVTPDGRPIDVSEITTAPGFVYRLKTISTGTPDPRAEDQLEVVVDGQTALFGRCISGAEDVLGPVDATP